MKTIIYAQARSGSTALFLQQQAAMSPQTQYYFEPVAFEMPPTGDMLVKSLVMSLPCDLGCPPLDPESFDQRYVLIRDPRDRLISVLLFLLHWHTPTYPPLWQYAPPGFETLLRLVRQKEQDPSSVTLAQLFDLTLWTRFCLTAPQALTTWRRLQEGFLTFQVTLPSHTLVWYEALMQGGTPDPPRSYASLRRHATIWDWRQWFTPADIDYFRPLMLPYMQRFGYRDDWTLSGTPTIDPASSSRYVEKWVRVQRRATYATRPA